MTLTNTTVRSIYSGDGVTVAFPTGFKFYDNDHVQVTHIDSSGAETVWTEGTQYSVTGSGEDSGGTVTVSTTPTDYTPAADEQLVILRVVPYTQEIDLPLGGDLPSTSVEKIGDIAAMQAQQLEERLDRSLHFPVGDGRTTELPNAAARANKYLLFDANGDATVGAQGDASSITLPVSVANGGTGSTSASDARSALAAAGTGVANTFTANQTIQSTDAGATEGPTLTLDRDSATPAASDVIGSIDWVGEDSAGNDQTYAQLQTVIVDPTSASEDGKLVARTVVAGTMADRVHIGGGLWMQGATGGDPGAGKINATEIQDDGVAISQPSAASQAQMEAASSTSVYATPGRTQYHPGVAKFWGKVTYSGGTPTLAVNHNVAGIVDNATGECTFTIGTDFSGANYAVAGAARASATTGGNDRTFNVSNTTGQVAGTCRFQIHAGGSSTTDPSEFYAVGFGDQ